MTTVEINTVQDFLDGWETMGEVDGKEVEINKVAIYSHGNENGLIFLEGSYTEAINISGENSLNQTIPKIADLDSKEINELNLYACNAGNYLIYVNKKGNVATEFSEKTEGGVTYAFDGNVAFGTPRWKIWAADTGYQERLSTTQASFARIRLNYDVTAKPKGKLKFMNGFMVSRIKDNKD